MNMGFLFSVQFLSLLSMFVWLLAIFAFDKYRLPLALGFAGFQYTWALILDRPHLFEHLWQETYAPLILETLTIMVLAMVTVGIMNRGGGFFAWLRHRIASKTTTDKQQMDLTDKYTWRLSYVIDNMTVTVAMCILIAKFYLSNGKDDKNVK